MPDLNMPFSLACLQLTRLPHCRPPTLTCPRKSRSRPAHRLVYKKWLYSHWYVYQHIPYNFTSSNNPCTIEHNSGGLEDRKSMHDRVREIWQENAAPSRPHRGVFENRHTVRRILAEQRQRGARRPAQQGVGSTIWVSTVF